MAETGAEGNFIAIFSSNDTDIQFYTDEYVEGMEDLDNMELDGKECKNTIIKPCFVPTDPTDAGPIQPETPSPPTLLQPVSSPPARSPPAAPLPAASRPLPPPVAPCLAPRSPGTTRSPIAPTEGSDGRGDTGEEWKEKEEGGE